MLNRSINFYGNFYYLINPRDQNGTSTLLGRIPTSADQRAQVKSGSSVNSVPDQYTMRIGANFKLNDWLLSAGIRNEGVPVHDLLGGSNGSRRAGHNTSIEPGIVYTMEKVSVYAYVPVIVSRKTRQSVTDKIESEILNKMVYRQGGFANYLIFFGVQIKL